MCTVSENVNWYSHYGKQYASAQKIKNEKLPYDPATLLLSIHPKEISVSKSYLSSRVYVSIIYN